MASFHTRTGSLIELYNKNRTACRLHPLQEFNNGVVLSADVLDDDELFEIKLDRKVKGWNGSLEIGLTSLDPEKLNFPVSATDLKQETWLISGNGIMQNGHTVIENFACDMEKLVEGDTVAVKRSSAGAFHIYKNGIDLGVAASGLPRNVHAIVDLYGKCSQVTIVNCTEGEDEVCADIANEALAGAVAQCQPLPQRLQFHEHRGLFIKLFEDGRSAERMQPLDEFNNGVVMTNRCLMDDEMFEVRIDRLVDKWSGSIEIGVTTHNPDTLEFPATMTNMRSGTIMMSGSGILTNGKGTRREYGHYNLDELKESDRIGCMRKADGKLHYYINGVDQGVAAESTAKALWGVVDLYGMTVKVTLIDDPCLNEGAAINNFSHINSLVQLQVLQMSVEDLDLELGQEHDEKLKFHSRCGSRAAVVNNGMTAHRPDAKNDFNYAVVLTNRQLQSDELFEVRLDQIVDKWAGSIEIGVTTHVPSELEFPSTMTNVRSGTWMIAGNGVMHNGNTVIEEYGQNLGEFSVGRTVGVMRTGSGNLHFYVDGVDQGQAASNVPPNVYGVIDLYGQAAQASIVDHVLPIPPVDSLNCFSELCFHACHGSNVQIIRNGRTAYRPKAGEEFNDAVVMSNRPLEESELFEIVIDRMVGQWSGSVEIGVTTIAPDEMKFPGTLTDLQTQTWMLSGSTVMCNGKTMSNNFPLDLDSLLVGARLGVMVKKDGSLHIFLDGKNFGSIAENVSSGAYAVLDLYGRCAQLSVCSNSPPVENVADHGRCLSSLAVGDANSARESDQRFSCHTSAGLVLSAGLRVARRDGNSTAVIFGSKPLQADETFEVVVDCMNPPFSGCLVAGVSTHEPNAVLPGKLCEVPGDDWLIRKGNLWRSKTMLQQNFMPSLERVQAGSRIGLLQTSEGSLKILLNNREVATIPDVSQEVWPVFEIPLSILQLRVAMSQSHSSLTKGPAISACKKSEEDATNTRCKLDVDNDSSDRQKQINAKGDDEHDVDTTVKVQAQFHLCHGKNIYLAEGLRTAMRTSSYNQAIVQLKNDLNAKDSITVQIDRLNNYWTSSIRVGLISRPIDRGVVPITALSFRKNSCFVVGSAVFKNGLKMRDDYGCDLDQLQEGDTVGIFIDGDSNFHILINGKDQGVVIRSVTLPCHAILDLYGRCTQVTLVESLRPETSTEKMDTAEKNDESETKKKEIPRIETNDIIKCRQYLLCSDFKKMLCLPEVYFLPGEECFCSSCFKSQSHIVMQGFPPRKFAVPAGWTRFPLRVASKAEVNRTYEKWHRAYCGCHSGLVRRLLDIKDPVLLGNHRDCMWQSFLSLSVHQHDERDKADESSDLQPLVMSPSILYASAQQFAPIHKFKSDKLEMNLDGQVVFEIAVKPGTYKLAAPTFVTPTDHGLNNAEVEWSTKERAATCVTALLIKVD